MICGHLWHNICTQTCLHTLFIIRCQRMCLSPSQSNPHKQLIINKTICGGSISITISIDFKIVLIGVCMWLVYRGNKTFRKQLKKIKKPSKPTMKHKNKEKQLRVQMWLIFFICAFFDIYNSKSYNIHVRCLQKTIFFSSGLQRIFKWRSRLDMQIQKGVRKYAFADV